MLLYMIVHPYYNSMTPIEHTAYIVYRYCKCNVHYISNECDINKPTISRAIGYPVIKTILDLINK